jgi:hypothetical protein
VSPLVNQSVNGGRGSNLTVTQGLVDEGRRYARRVSRAVRFHLPVILFLVAGCAISLDGGARPPPAPADSVELSVYMRDLSRLPHYFLILGEQRPDPEGPVSTRPATIGCSEVGRDWELMVSQSDGRPDPASDMDLRVSGQAFGNPDSLSLWLSVEADGTVVTGVGVPEWWGEERQRC